MMFSTRQCAPRAVRVARKVATPARVASAARRVAGRRVAPVMARFGGAVASKVAAIKPLDAKSYALNKGYTLLDVRSPSEHAAGSKRWFVSMPFESESSFKAAFTAAFPMKSARIIVADGAGGSTSSSAASVLASLGYTNAVVLDGGVSSYLKVDPLVAGKDKISKSGASASSWSSSPSPSSGSSERFNFAKPAAAAPSSFSFRSSGSSGSSKFAAIKPIDAKKCAMDKGYTLLDIRSTQEHNAASKKWFVSMPFDSESSFKSAFTAAFPMKSARIVLACDDGSDRTSAAAGVLASLGYTNVNTVEGGVNAYLRFDPLTSKDKASGGAAAAYKPAAAAATSRFSLSDRSSPSPSVSSGKYAMVKPMEAKKLALDKGFTLIDLRSASVSASASKKWFLNVPFDSESKFKSEFQTKFFNKMARVILADDDGSKSSAAAAALSSLGYNAFKVLDGGLNAYFAYDPLTSKDAPSASAFHRPGAMASSPAAAAPSSTDRFAFASKGSSASASSSSGGLARSSGSSKFPAVKPVEAKGLALNKGYVLLDVRSASEHKAANKKWFVNIPANGSFKSEVEKAYPFKSARLIVADSNGGADASAASSALSSLGYTNVVVLEGGVSAYLKFDPVAAAGRR